MIMNIKKGIHLSTTYVDDHVKLNKKKKAENFLVQIRRSRSADVDVTTQ